MERPLDYGALERARDCNYWAWDPTLRRVTRRAYPDAEFEWARPVLADYGTFVGTTLADNADLTDRHDPQLHTHDRNGDVVNAVEYHPVQFESERYTYEDARLTHDAFHAPPDREEPVGVIHPLTMQTLLCYADVGLACAASMTTGAALVLEKFDDGGLDEQFRRLTTADYERHEEGAMFLTERQAGSDVGAVETRAEPRGDGTYAITGEKWFCSNVDAQGALVLARTPDAPAGTAGLSLFLVPHERDGAPNGKRVRRLKDKLGTLSVPTGEVEFEGATGYLVGEETAGFRQMTEMLNYERVTNATGAVGVAGRALLAAKVHAAHREAFGERLQDLPLMRRDLAELTVEYEAAAAFAFAAARQYDRRERACSEGSDVSRRESAGAEGGDPYRLMRLLVPVAKYRTAETAVDVTGYAMEVLGGDGYVREQVTERLFRDAQVLPIWEGTSNVLSLDLLRALDRADAHEALIPYVTDLLAEAEHPALTGPAATVRERFRALQSALGTLASEGDRYAQYHAKRLADLVFDVVAGALLLSAAQDRIDEAADGRLALVARLFVDDRFGDADAYGVAGGEMPGDEWFDAVARYAPVDPAAVGDAGDS